MDLFHIQTRRLWSAVSHGDSEKVLSALKNGADVNAWCLHGRDSYPLNEKVGVDFYRRPILVAALANRYDIVMMLLSNPKVKLNAICAFRPKLECSLTTLYSTTKFFGGCDDIIQSKLEKLRRPRRFFFSLEDIVRLNKDPKNGSLSPVSQIILNPQMTSFLEKRIKIRKVAGRDSIPNLASVLQKVFDDCVNTRT